MTIHYRIIAGIAVAVLLGTSNPTLAQQRPRDQHRDRWLARVRDEMPNLENNDRSLAAEYVVAAIAESGDGKLAKEVMVEFVSVDKQPHALISIASAQSSNDQLNQALETVAELTTEGQRQRALGLVIARQANRGDIEDAILLVPKMKDGWQRDLALSAIANAQAVAGDRDAALATAERISADERQQVAKEAIANANADPVINVKSRFLRKQVEVVLLFSNANAHAVTAIAAAERKDDDSLDEHLALALKDSDDGIEVERATTATMLAVALAEAGRRDDAKEMIERARKANGREWLGLSNIFGSPILVYLLIRLDLNDELKELIKSLETEDSIDRIGYHSNLYAAGAAFAELGQLDHADTFHNQLKSSRDRVYFAAGVLSELQFEKHND